MSADDFQTKYASFMEHIVKSTVEETTKLFETMVDDLKAELSKAKMENEALKTTCRENETVNTPSINESSQSEGPERRDTAVQCDLLSGHASLGQSAEDQNSQRAHEELVYSLLKDHDYDASFKDIFYQSQPEMLTVSQPTVTSNELFLALSDSSTDSSGETDTEDDQIDQQTDTEDYQIDQQTDTEDYRIDQQTETEDIGQQCTYGICGKRNKCLGTAVQAGLKRDSRLRKQPTKSAKSPATADQTLGRRGYATPTTFQEQLAAPKVQIQHQSFVKTRANKQAGVVVQHYSGVPHPEEQQVEPRLTRKQMREKEQQVEPRLLRKRMRGKEQQVEPRPQEKEQQLEPRLPEKQMEGKEQQVESTLLKKQMEQKELQVESTLLIKQMERKEQQKEPTLREKQIERKEQQVQSTLQGKQPEGKKQQVEPTVLVKELEGKEQPIKQTLPERELEGKEQQGEPTLLEKQMERKEQQVEPTVLVKELEGKEQPIKQTLPEKELEGKEQQGEPTLLETQMERKEQQVEPTVLVKELEGKEQPIKQTLPEKELEGKEQPIKQTLPEKELEGKEQQGEPTLLEKQMERKEQQVESILMEKQLDVGGNKCSLTEEERQVEQTLVGKEQQVEPTVLEKEVVGKEQQVEPTVLEEELVAKEPQTKQTPPEKELEGTELQVEQPLLEKPLKEGQNKCGSTEEKANVEINVTVNKNRRQRKQPSDKVKRLLPTPKQIGVSASNDGEEHNGVDHVPTIFERYTSLCEVAKVNPRSCTTEWATKASPAKSSVPLEIRSVQGNASSKKTRRNSPHQDRSAHKKTEFPRKSLIKKSGRSKKFYGITNVCLRSSTAKDTTTTTTNSPLKTTDPPGPKERISTRENSALKKTQTNSPLQDRSENTETESSGKRSTRNSANLNKSHGVSEVSLRSSTTKDSATTSPQKIQFSPEIISAQENASSKKIQTVSPHQDVSCRKKTESSDNGLGQDGASSEKSLWVPEVCLRSSTTRETTSTLKSTVPPESISAEENAGSQLTQTISPHQDLSAHKKTKLSKNSATSKKSHSFPEVCVKLSTTKDTTKTSPAKTALPPVSMSIEENASLKKTQTNFPQQDRSSHKEAESLGTELSRFSASSKSHGVTEVGLILSTTKETTATSPPKSPFPPEIISTEETASSKKTLPNSPQQERPAHKKTDSSVARLTKISASSKKVTSPSEVVLRSSTTKVTTTSPPKSAFPPEIISIQENTGSKKTETNSLQRDMSGHKKTDSLGTRLTRDSAGSKKDHEAPEVFLRSGTTKDTATTSPLQSTLLPEIISTPKNTGSKKTRTNSPHQDKPGNKKAETSRTKLSNDSASSKKAHEAPEVFLRSGTTKDTTTTSPLQSTLLPEIISTPKTTGSKKTRTNSPHQDKPGNKETDSLGTRLTKDSASSKKAHEAPEVFLSSGTTKDTATTSPLQSTLLPEIIFTPKTTGSKKTRTNSPHQDKPGNKKAESSGTKLSNDSASSKKAHGAPEVFLRSGTTKDTTTTSPLQSTLLPEIISTPKNTGSKKTRTNSPHQDKPGNKETDSLGTRLTRDSASSKKAHEAPEVFLRSGTTKDTTTTSPLQSTLLPEIISTPKTTGSKKTRTNSPHQDKPGNKKAESSGTKLSNDSASSKKSRGVPKLCVRFSSTKDATTTSPQASELPSGSRKRRISTQENAGSKKTLKDSPHQDSSGNKKTESSGTKLAKDSTSCKNSHEVSKGCQGSGTTKDTTASLLKSIFPPGSRRGRIVTRENTGSKKSQTSASAHKKTTSSGSKLPKGDSNESPSPSVGQKASSFIENDAGLKESCSEPLSSGNISEEEPTPKRLKRPYSSLSGNSSLSSPQRKKMPKKASALSKARETIAKKPKLDQRSISEKVKIRKAKKLAQGSIKETVAKKTKTDPSKLRKRKHDSSDETGNQSTSPSVPARKAPALRAKRSSFSPVQKEAQSLAAVSPVQKEAPSPMSPAVGSPPHGPSSARDVNTPLGATPAQTSFVIGQPLLKNQCGQCGRVLSSPAVLVSHLNLHIGHRPFSCRICRKDFPDARGLRRHSWVHADHRIHVCQQCGKGFVYSYGLTKHLQMVHRKIKPFVCQICDKAFFTKNDVEDHIRIHTGEKPFQCHLCGKRFVKNLELKMHVKWHNGEKRHWCPYCGKGFFDYNNLKRHKYIHTGEKPKSCPHCPKHFKQSSHLKKHIRTIHKDV
ncbi:putative mediator of RNA polymerase II transcription subunit 26 [Nerophis ophidion]|uniref:putative mediator of RNA polymerase II transcription subunit 26 n=1 Tax=Nerophis ophidion TaxID=159077 RepID=UPI002ADF8FD6|nr:putative mediator of RNA polymerase II transcription subunit 26 [Nerophis ophidion]